jgi:hypothetical protein
MPRRHQPPSATLRRHELPTLGNAAKTGSDAPSSDAEPARGSEPHVKALDGPATHVEGASCTLAPHALHLGKTGRQHGHSIARLAASPHDTPVLHHGHRDGFPERQRAYTFVQPKSGWSGVSNPSMSSQATTGRRNENCDTRPSSVSVTPMWVPSHRSQQISAIHIIPSTTVSAAEP